MTNFPSKWLDFVNYKEIKRLRANLENTSAIKIQTPLSVVAAILSFVFSSYINNWAPWGQILFCIGLIAGLMLIFIGPNIVVYIKKQRIGVILKSGKEATKVFDEEITYYVLVACEYYNNSIKIPESELNEKIVKFYNLEIKYYVTEAVERLHELAINPKNVFGQEKGRISQERFKNVVDMIDLLIKKDGINIDKSIEAKYSAVKMLV